MRRVDHSILLYPGGSLKFVVIAQGFWMALLKVARHKRVARLLSRTIMIGDHARTAGLLSPGCWPLFD